MLRLSIRTLFSLTPSRSLHPYSIFPTPSRSLSPYSILTAQCCTSSPPHFSHPHSHGVPDPRNVRVSVWWDLDKCNMPSGVNVFRGAQAITAAIESSGIKGPIQIKAFGDILRLARTDQQALSSSASSASTAINFIPIRIGEDEESADSCLFQELIFWTSSNPPPVHLFIITGFGGYTSTLHHLRMNNYNLLLASKESAPAVGCSAATIMWNWDALVRGETLTGRYFNQPPKEYLYGHYEGPLEKIPAFAPDNQPRKVHEVFSYQNSFWVELQTFMNSDVGSFISAESSTREKMAYYLQKYGPSLLKSVSKSDALHLVDILIRRGWVNESPYFV